ncbi:hippurate hydrolase [Orbus hercynius]|uniref:Hippurate hydrolase n=1 Tax=Orbus hercynius TaxID=593135 RepID=A0A495RJR8_9GAMM|nr:amidohydrolase [Orbus hercynius]RKS87554.1 hippurate hydrolase [Orbus hercynius]
MSYLTQEALDQLSAIRQDIHTYPEIAYEEKRTAGIVANYLRQCHVDEVHENVGGYGVVGIINGKKPGKSIALRADMDALAIQEVVPQGEERPHCSVIPNRFHGCGHDGHTAMLLGAAKYLAEQRNFAGRVVLIFQPGEENLSGAAEMLKDGLMTRFPFEEVYGVHNTFDLPLGHITINDGPALSALDNFTINIKGNGSHGATPHLSIDPIMIAAKLITDLQTIVSRNVPPLQSAVLSLGAIEGGTTFNVIPDLVQLKGCLRSYNDDVRQLLKTRMQALVKATEIGFNCQIALNFVLSCPAVINDTTLAMSVYNGIKKQMGADNVNLSVVPQTPSEDFAFYLQHAKGVYGFIGINTAKPVHHPEYDFNDKVIPFGVAFWASVVQARLPL